MLSNSLTYKGLMCIAKEAESISQYKHSRCKHRTVYYVDKERARRKLYGVSGYQH